MASGPRRPSVALSPPGADARLAVATSAHVVLFHVLSAPGHGGVYVRMTGLGKAGALGNGGGIR